MWLPIDAVYSVSIDGQVKRYGKLMKGSADSLGYRQVSQYNKLRMIHRLVASRFLPQPTSDECEIDHIDRDRSNNHASNLRWCSRSDNMINRDHKKPTTGEQYVTRYALKSGDIRYVFRYGQKNGKYLIQQYFSIKEEAITARDNFINSM